MRLLIAVFIATILREVDDVKSTLGGWPGARVAARPGSRFGPRPGARFGARPGGSHIWRVQDEVQISDLFPYNNSPESGSLPDSAIWWRLCLSGMRTSKCEEVKDN